MDASQDPPLVLLVGDSETDVEPDVPAEFAEECGAKSVDRATLDFLGGVPEAVLEPMGYFISCLVREGERTDASRVNVELLDQAGYALGQAIRLASAGSGEHQQWAGRSADGAVLRRRRD
jgi:hypothetical protein